MQKQRQCIACGAECTRHSKSQLCAPCATRATNLLGDPKASAKDLQYAAMVLSLEGGREEDPKDWSRWPTLPGNCLAFSDIHAPFQDAKWLAYAVKEAKKNHLSYAALGGDALDFKEISRFPKEQRHGNTMKSLEIGIRMLGALAQHFPGGIWIEEGNHEYRLERAIESSVLGQTWIQAIVADLELGEIQDLPFKDRYVNLMNQMTRKFIGPKLAKRIHWIPGVHLNIQGPTNGDPWIMIHQGNGSRNPPWEAKYHWEKYQRPVIVTHTHLVGMRVAPNGTDPMIQLGMNTREEWHSYTYREPSGYPNWVRSFALIKNGKLLKQYFDTPYTC